MKYLTRSHVFPPSYTFVLELRWPVDVDLEMATSILRYHHEVRVVALYEVDEVLLLLVRYDDLLPLLFLQPQTCQGVFLEELHPCSFPIESSQKKAALPRILRKLRHVDVTFP